MEKNPIILLELPAIDGLTLHTSKEGEVGDISLSSLEGIPGSEEIRAAFTEGEVAQQRKGWLVAERNHQIMSAAVIESWHEEDGRWVYQIHGWVLPEWRGRGFGSAMLHWGENESRNLAAVEHAGERFEYGGRANSTDSDSILLLLNAGYSFGYTDLEMELDPAAPLTDSPLPPGVELRPALSEHVPLIAESIAEAYRNEFPDHRFHHTHSEAAGQAAWYSNPVHDRSLWQVAWDPASGTVVGQVLPILNNQHGYIDEVSVRPAWRRNGLARALLTRALVRLRSLGATVIRLNTTNEFRTRSRDLYTSLGFRVVKTVLYYRKSPGAFDSDSISPS
jgi:ribosomal protein S18 acetylase RimI-like enzyme